MIKQILLFLITFLTTVIFFEYYLHPEPRPPILASAISLFIKSRTKFCSSSTFPQPAFFSFCRKYFWIEDRFIKERIDLEHVNVEFKNISSTSAEVEGGDIPLEIYTPKQGTTKDTILFYLHGGGWVARSPQATGAKLINTLTKQGYIVVAVNYRKAPEHPFPTAVEDVVEGYKWALDTYKDKKIVLIGDSAGGNLAGSLAILARDRNIQPSRIESQVLIYPVTTNCTHRATLESGQKFAKGGIIIDAVSVQRFEALYNPKGLQDPRIYLLLNEDLSKLPPALIITAGNDILRSEGQLYAQKLEEAGVPVQYHEVKNLNHGGLSLPSEQQREMLSLILNHLGKK